VIDLVAFHRRAAKKVLEGIARRLRQGRGIGGRVLPRKRIDNGRPLGFGRSRGGIPARVRRATIRAYQVGFDLVLGDLAPHPGDVIFHTGRRGQVQRPIYGVTAEDAREMAKLTREALLAEARRLGLAR
jgi:hypothetical protein